MPPTIDFQSDRPADRHHMVEQIERHFLETGTQTGEPTLFEPVREALESVPRHEFVPISSARRAYDDAPLPIGSGQTISQPFIVALMTQLARIEPTSVVLEVGTGSGFQTAVLAELTSHVLSIERVPELAARAAATLERLGYKGVEIRSGDGYAGWSERSPFDAIVVTAGANEVPPPLVEQLAPNGRLVIPVSTKRGYQDLLVLTKDGKGEASTRSVLPVAFVPLIHDSRSS